MHPMHGFPGTGASYTKRKPDRPRNSRGIAQSTVDCIWKCTGFVGKSAVECIMREADEMTFPRDLQTAGSSFHGLSLHRMVPFVQPACGVQIFNGRGSVNSGQFGHR